jgi:protein ImuB
MCVWLPNWPIQRIQAAEPQLANQPLVLTSRDARRGLVVTAANLMARVAGVRSQMRLAEATGLAELELRQHEPDEDLEALCSLAEQAQRFSPLVGIEQLDKRVWAGRWLQQPESLLLDVTGLAELFAGYDNLMLQIGGWLQQQRYFGCIATASTVGAAWALANFALRGKQYDEPAKPIATTQPSTTTQPSSADETANSETTNSELPPVPPSRYLHVEQSAQRDCIERLSLTALRIDEATHTTLRRLGLRTIGQLNQLPREGLANRLGKQLLRRCDQVSGECDEPVIALHGQPDWCVEQELEIATDHTETIAELVRRGLERLASGLDKRGEGALRVVCRLDLVEHVPLILQMGMFRPTSDAKHLNLLAASLLEQQLPKQMKAPMWRITVQATLTAPLVWRQGDLFNASEAANRQEIAALVDTLSARLGRKQVLRARTARESQPELAFDLQPLTGLRPDGHAQDTVRKISSRLATSTVEPARDDPLRRPAQLLQPPTPIVVAGTFNIGAPPGFQGLASEIKPDNTPSVQDPFEGIVNATQSAGPTSSLEFGKAAAPARIKTANGWHQVMGAIGPERLESGWWKGQSARRDYYRIITQLGCWWWIYRDLKSGNWFLHGIFD